MTNPSEELKTSKDRLLSLFDRGEVSLGFQENYTEVIDQYFRRSFQESPVAHSLFRDKRHFAIVPVGGYGRKELCIYSDIDIILLFNSKIPSRAKSLAEDILYPLWDLGLDLGYGIRTIRDCINLCKNEFEVFKYIECYIGSVINRV